MASAFSINKMGSQGGSKSFGFPNYSFATIQFPDPHHCGLVIHVIISFHSVYIIYHIYIYIYIICVSYTHIYMYMIYIYISYIYIYIYHIHIYIYISLHCTESSSRFSTLLLSLVAMGSHSTLLRMLALPR